MVLSSLSTFGVWPDLSGQVVVGPCARKYVRSVTPGSYVVWAAAGPANAPKAPITATAIRPARLLQLWDKRPPPRPNANPTREVTEVLSASKDLLTSGGLNHLSSFTCNRSRPPVPAAEQGHRGRQQQATHHRDVEQHGQRHADAD